MVTGHSSVFIRTGEKHTNKDKLHTNSTRRAVQTTCQQSSLLEPSNLVIYTSSQRRKQVKDAETHLLELRTRVSRVLDLPRAQSHQPIAALVIVISKNVAQQSTILFRIITATVFHNSTVQYMSCLFRVGARYTAAGSSLFVCFSPVRIAMTCDHSHST